jgi:hypothetical protein
MTLVRQFAARWARWWAWKLETVLSGADIEPLPPSPLDDPVYWDMIDIVKEAWGQTCTAAHTGGVPLDFEASFFTRATEDIKRAKLAAAAQQAAIEEIDRRLAERRTVLARVRLIDSRCSGRGDSRQVRLMWLHRQVGMIEYAICPAREHGWLAKINIELDYARGGLGRRGLAYLMARYPKATWTTSGQMSHARGFWSTMQSESDAGWTQLRGSCPHGWNPLG